MKQGDIIAPILVSIYLRALISYAVSDCNTGVSLRFRATGKLFNLRRFYVKPNTILTLVRQLLYADDTDFITDIPSKRDKINSIAKEVLQR